MIFLERFVSDLPESRYLSTELRLWEDHCSRLEGKPTASVSDLLPTIDKVSFPNTYTARQILATLPVQLAFVRGLSQYYAVLRHICAAL